MDCKEFRKQITAGSDNLEEMLEHRKNCQDCESWLMKEVSTAPEGISEEEWKKLRQGLKKGEERIKKKEDEEKSFLDYYLSGLKYGLVFGLAVVIGFSIIQNQNEAREREKLALQKSQIAIEEEKNLRAKSLEKPALQEKQMTMEQEKLIASDNTETASPSQK